MLAAMPKTPIHKDNDLSIGKQKIRTSQNTSWSNHQPRTPARARAARNLPSVDLFPFALTARIRRVRAALNPRTYHREGSSESWRSTELNTFVKKCSHRCGETKKVVPREKSFLIHSGKLSLGNCN